MKSNGFLHRTKDLIQSNKIFASIVVKKYWPLFIMQTLTILLSGLSAALISKTSKLFLESIIFDKSLTRAMSFIIFWMCYMLVMNAMQHFTTTYTNFAYAKAQIKVKESIYKRISNLKLSYFDVPKNRDVLTRAIQYSENGGPQLFNYLFSLLTNIVAIVSILYVLTPFAWWITVFLIGLTIYKTIIEIYISKKNFRFQKEKTLLNRKIAYFGGLFSNPSTILDMNIFNAFSYFFAKYKNEQDKSICLNKNHGVKVNLCNLLALLSVIAQNIILYFYIGSGLIKGLFTIADFTMFFTAVNSFNTILTNFRKSVSQFVPMTLEAQNYMDFLKVPVEDQYVLGTPMPIEKRTELHEIDTIEFRHVSFRYPLKNNYVLRDVSFTIHKGQIVSIVGLNGAGKTTLIKLLLGLYTPTEGDILINNMLLSSINILSLWQCCGTLFQNFNIYSLPVYENITFEDSYKNDIDSILEETGLKTLFDQQEMGIHTELSRNFDSHGIALSGGEKQKVAFARLRFHGRSLLVLDEPSSALDAKSENDLFQLIDCLHTNFPDGIVLFVSHRLSSSTRANKILFIQNGTILNSGDHLYMMGNSPEYKNLFLMQAEKYLNSKETT